jgi:hypothetical protein
VSQSLPWIPLKRYCTAELMRALSACTSGHYNPQACLPLDRTSQVHLSGSGSFCRIQKLLFAPKRMREHTPPPSLFFMRAPLARLVTRLGETVAGMDDGSSSLSFALPEPEFVEFPLHTAAVTGLVVSADGRFLFSSAEDGTVFVMGIPYPLPTRASKAAAALGVSMSLGTCTW